MKKNEMLDEIDHDLDIIFSDYLLFKNNKLTPSEYRFAIQKKDIDELLRINPQVYLPNLNETIRKIQEIDKNGWEVTTIGQIDKNIQIFKGPRFKSENIIVDDPADTAGLEAYYTPTAILQEKSESAKYIDIKKADKKQLYAIACIRVRRGDIVISRSGTIGRIAYITKRLDNAIASDDLIRIRIKNEDKRLYIFAYLQTEYAQNQMKKNEYGSIQQHLEPVHVKDILIPFPENIDEINDVVESTKMYVKKREEMEEKSNCIYKKINELMNNLI
jgi:hypothetical protein